MEHLSTFGLTREPFAGDMRANRAFKSAGGEEAVRRLLRVAEGHKGFSLLTGPAGVGKTLLVRRVLEALEEEVFEACMLVPVAGISDGDWLLSRFARQLGIEDPAADRADLLGQIYEQMAIVREDGRHTVLLVDEAEVLADMGLLPHLRGLLNLEYEDRRLLSLVLVGRPSLAEAVEREPALCDRVDTRVSLSPLTEDECRKYIEFRIRGVDGAPAILEAEAVSALVKWGLGLPRRINTLADNALFEAHLAGRVSANAGDVERSATDLGYQQGCEPGLDAGPPDVMPAAAAASLAASAPAVTSEVTGDATPAPLEMETRISLDPPAPGPASAVRLETADAVSFDFGSEEPVADGGVETSLDDMFEDSAADMDAADDFVVAAPTDPGMAEAGATVAIFPDEQPVDLDNEFSGGAAPDATVALFDDAPLRTAIDAFDIDPADPMEDTGPVDAGATVALFDDGDLTAPNSGASAVAGQTMAILDDPNERSDGDLDDLFADLVDDGVR